MPRFQPLRPGPARAESATPAAGPGEHLNEFPNGNDSMQRQHCHSEEVIGRRRICNLAQNRFLTALRLSFSSLLGIIRKRSLLSLRSSIHFVQNDKGLGIRTQPRGTPGDSRMFAGLRGARLRPARLKRAEERRNVNRSKPLFRILRCIPFSDCSFTPAAGYRVSATGALGGIGVSGSWWSSSPFSASVCVASALWLYPSEVRPTDSGTLAFRSVAVSVRCVQASAGSCRRGAGAPDAPEFPGIKLCGPAFAFSVENHYFCKISYANSANNAHLWI